MRCTAHTMDHSDVKKEWDIATLSNTDEPREYHAYWSKVRERQIQSDVAYTWNLKMVQRICMQNRSRLTDMESKVLVYQRVKEGEKQIRNTRLTDINCNTQNRKAARTDCLAQGITFSTLWQPIMEYHQKKSLYYPPKTNTVAKIKHVCVRLVTQSCPALCDPREL